MAPSEVSKPVARPYVVAWKLEGKRVVVVGAGEIGEAKIETLLPACANLTAIDPTPGARVRELAANDQLVLKERRVCPLDLLGASLVVIATGDHEANARIAGWARRLRVTVNAVDDPSLCDVTIPAVVERGPATIAITTGGATPAGARFLRERLTNLVPSHFGEVLEHAKVARNELRHTGAYRYDYAAWRDHYFSPAWDAAARGDDRDITELRESFVRSFTEEVPGGTGRVTLVGAGPGGPDLITLRGARALAEADVILYDRLAPRELLDMAPRVAVRIPVGKGKGFGVSQSEIEGLIVSHASAGSHVVRLKGGDPFVFGRGCEELRAAELRGIPVTVVPGLTSALAAPAAAGISVTDRALSSGFVTISGHRASAADYDWHGLAHLDLTLVVLMASGTADVVAQRLIDGGLDPTTGVSFVHGLGGDEQAIATRTLAEVAESGCPFGSPTVMTIGAVVHAGANERQLVVNHALR